MKKLITFREMYEICFYASTNLDGKRTCSHKDNSFAFTIDFPPCSPKNCPIWKGLEEGK